MVDEEEDGQPLLTFTQRLLPGLVFGLGAIGRMQRIDSDTTDPSLIFNRLLLSGLPPLRADASEAELQSDLSAIVQELLDRDIIRRKYQLEWIARAPVTDYNDPNYKKAADRRLRELR